MTRRAQCSCGQLSATCAGEPGRISVCHCHDCQRRSGSAFAAQAWFPAAQATFAGESRVWERIGDSGARGYFHSCPDCSATVWYAIEAMPGQVAVPLGAFADDSFPPPRFSVYENRKKAWVEITGDVARD